jgi:lysophospholipase L1-like esterase
MTRQTRFKIVAVVVSTMVGLVLVGGGLVAFLDSAKTTERPVPPVITQSKVMQEVFGGSAFEALMRHVSQDQFSTVWDFDEQILMSRSAFVQTEMFGTPKFHYKPNTHVANLHLWTGVSKQRLILGMTPETEALLAKMSGDVIHREDFETDRHGFKQTEFEPEPGATVFFLGDSFTEGLWVSPKETFVNLYGRRLRADGVPLVPVNLGVNGFSALEMRWMLETHAPTLRPTAAVFNLYPNDVGAEYTAAITQPEGMNAEFAALFAELSKAKAYCEAHGIRMLLALVPGQAQLTPGFRQENPVFDAFQRRVAAWATKEAVPCFDALPHLHRVGAEAVFLTWDGHFSPKGHDHYAGFLYDETRALMASLAPPPPR